MKTYILGAGSSCEFGYPLGKDIFPKAKEMASSEIELLKREHAQHLRCSYQNVQKNFNLFFGDIYNEPHKWPSFEEIFTFVDRVLSNPSDMSLVGITEQLRRDLRTVIFFTLVSCGFKPFLAEHKLSDIYSECIGKIFADRDVKIISFNYDVLLPYAFKVNRITPDYGYTCYEIEANEEDKILYFGDRKVDIVLPHGAVNLADCPNCKRRYFSIDPFTASIKNFRANCPKCKVNLIDDFLIPPSFNKYIERSNDAARFIEFISGAEEIYIIGYSFPSYDYYTRILFLHALSRNTCKPKITIIDIGDIDVAREKYDFIDQDRFNVNFELEGFKNYFYR